MPVEGSTVYSVLPVKVSSGFQGRSQNCMAAAQAWGGEEVGEGRQGEASSPAEPDRTHRCDALCHGATAVAMQLVPFAAPLPKHLVYAPFEPLPRTKHADTEET